MSKRIAIEMYRLGQGILLQCAGPEEKMETFNNALHQKEELTIEWILSRMDILEIYCYPSAPLKRWRFLLRFRRDLREIGRLITKEQFEQAWDLCTSIDSFRKVGFTDEEYQQYVKSTYWYQKGWSV